MAGDCDHELAFVYDYSRIPLGKSGVYVISDIFTGEYLYVGKANDLRKRLYQYAEQPYSAAYRKWREIEDNNNPIINIYYHDTPAVLEATLIKKHKPKYNLRIREGVV